MRGGKVGCNTWGGMVRCNSAAKKNNRLQRVKVRLEDNYVERIQKYRFLIKATLRYLVIQILKCLFAAIQVLNCILIIVQVLYGFLIIVQILYCFFV